MYLFISQNQKKPIRVLGILVHTNFDSPFYFFCFSLYHGIDHRPYIIIDMKESIKACTNELYVLISCIVLSTLVTV